MEGYAAAKRRILLNQGKGDTAVIGVDDDWGQRICTEITAANRRTIWPISARKAMGRGVYALQGRLYDATDGRVTEVADLDRAPAPCRAGTTGRTPPPPMPRSARWASPPAEAVEGLMSFPGPGPPHGDDRDHRRRALRQRLQGHQHRRRAPGDERLAAFLLDRRRAAEDAASAASPISSDPLSRAYLIGEAAADFARTLEGKAPVVQCGALEAATRAAFDDARASGEDESDRALLARLRLLRPVQRLRSAGRGVPRRGACSRFASSRNGPLVMAPRQHPWARTDTSRWAQWWWTTDRWLLGATAALILLGVLLQFGTSPAAAARLGIAWPFHFAVRQCDLCRPWRRSSCWRRRSCGRRACGGWPSSSTSRRSPR